ncbi:hypothetical protein [Actinomadura flavalba]|uniref:hypothetical protein n=1 Tax=Actinomadura flavalba TaxID=1120938 RepID=UPI000373D3E3|nr:hypothetical protein [Actinomadura flavalba]
MKRAPKLPAALLVGAGLLAGCGGGDDGARPGPPPSTGRAALAGTGYTSDQLEQALLTDLPGFRRVGEPESGEYGTLAPVQRVEQLQRQVRIDKKRCSDATGERVIDRTMPAAITSFAKSNGVSATQTLLGVPDAEAEDLVKVRVPAGCQTFRTTVGTQSSDHRVVELPPGTLGEGSRTVGVSTVSGNSNTKSWYVVLRGRRHVVTISLYGPVATRTAAEDIARAAADQARRVLP